MFEWRTFDDLANCCRANFHNVRRLNVDVVIGVPRSGMLPASILATALSIPLTDLHSFCGGTVWKWRRELLSSQPFKHALLIDDSSGSGKSMTAALAILPPGLRVTTCAVYATKEAAANLGMVFEICPKPRKFEWNLWRDGWLSQVAVDMDGVLCIDPTREQRKDDELYQQFAARDAIPLLRPMRPLGAIITGRHVKWRSETETWLHDHSIEYGALSMWNGEGTHNEHKIRMYRKSGFQLFIESEDKHSQTIAATCRRPVLCSKSRKLYVK